MTDSVRSSELPSSPIEIMAVIVLYRMAPDKSASYRSLMASAQHLNPNICRLHTLVWDNTPDEQHKDMLGNGVLYVADRRNSGLANAYNHALESAIELGCDWFITLDQDTDLPVEYLGKLVEAAHLVRQGRTVAAIVPQITANGVCLSPNYFQWGAIPRWYPIGYVGRPHQATFAFNSAAMINVQALEQIGGYDPWFWLDNSDARMFRQLHAYGKCVFVAGNIQVDHEFSMKNMNERMSAARYENILLAESAFWDSEMNWLAGLERTLRLALRMVKHVLRKDKAEFRAITLKFLWRRLFRSKHFRTGKWRTETRARLGDALESSALRHRPLKISVCMAAYNGGRYIEAQLSSILPQLRAGDEVVIVDDCSKDDTVAKVKAIQDRRIVLMQHPINKGVVATFEDALRSASGDILFLCDDDDLWAPGKVQKFLDAFQSDPEVMIVTSRVSLIDECGEPFVNPQFNRGGKFFPGFWRNVFKNHYQGSAMAIRASLLGQVLPFPHRPAFLHDAWIGTRNDLTGGKTLFIDEDLLLYRRHSGNFSRRLPRLKQLRVRAELLWAHLRHALICL